MKVDFDKRLELIFGLQYSTARKNNVNFDWIKETNKEYDDKFYEMYNKAITPEFEKYILDGGISSYDGSVLLALHLDDNYNFIDLDSFEERIVNDPKIDLKLLESYLKEFVSTTNYEKFYESSKYYYNSVKNQFSNILKEYEGLSIDKLINFYGYKKGDMSILFLNFSSGSYGMTYKDNLIYCYGLINKFNDMNPMRFIDSISTNAYHEFSHPYINPLGYKYFKDIELPNVMNDSKNNGLQSCYDDIRIVLNEYCVRAISIILSEGLVEDEYITEYINRTKRVGYSHIDELMKVFDKKDNYKTFEEFYKNEIVTYFVNLNNELEYLNTDKKAGK